MRRFYITFPRGLSSKPRHATPRHATPSHAKPSTACSADPFVVVRQARICDANRSGGGDVCVARAALALPALRSGQSDPAGGVGVGKRVLSQVRYFPTMTRYATPRQATPRHAPPHAMPRRASAATTDAADRVRQRSLRRAEPKPSRVVFVGPGRGEAGRGKSHSAIRKQMPTRFAAAPVPQVARDGPRARAGESRREQT